MGLGPLELLVLSFPAERLKDGALATLEQISRTEDMRVVDVLVVRTDSAGGACTVELRELPGRVAASSGTTRNRPVREATAADTAVDRRPDPVKA